MVLFALILAAAAGYSIAVKWGSGPSPAIAASIGAGAALVMSVVLGLVGLGGVSSLLLSVAAGAGTVYALRSKAIGSPAKAAIGSSTSGGRSTTPSSAASGGSTPAEAPTSTLPTPDHYTSDEEAGAAMDSVGEIQRRFESGTMTDDEIAVMGEEISRKCQGIVDYFVSQGREINLYKSVVEPICGWAIGQLAPLWIVDQGTTPHSAAAKRAYYDITALMEKYSRLKPA
ncbi:hypothetical protein AYJ66_05580 [Dietzia cinnamea]|nr:hypothetical protein AYJ66_05580 [Dietzia cinnamea]